MEHQRGVLASWLCLRNVEKVVKGLGFLALLRETSKLIKNSWSLGHASRNVAVDEKSRPVRGVSEKDPWLEARTYEKS